MHICLKRLRFADCAFLYNLEMEPSLPQKATEKQALKCFAVACCDALRVTLDVHCIQMLLIHIFSQAGTLF